MTEAELFAVAEAERAAAPGWCSAEKAAALVRCVLDANPATVVEVGVFGGASLLPLALAAKFLGTVDVWGVDPWHMETATEGITDRANLDWWRGVDLGAVRRHCEGRLRALGLTGVCRIFGGRSEVAVIPFDDGSVDLLHLDGNHSEAPCLRDAKLWLPKVRAGGVIFFDDLSWRDNGVLTTRPALSYLLRNGCTMVSVIGDCGILLKGA